jgi:hypothetical protein
MARAAVMSGVVGAASWTNGTGSGGIIVEFRTSLFSA